MHSNSGERFAGLVNSAKVAMGIPSKLEHLHRLKQELVEQDNAVIVSEILPRIFELQSDSFAPVRKCVIEYGSPNPIPVTISFIAVFLQNSLHL